MNLIYLHSFCIFVVIYFGSSVSSADYDYTDPSTWGNTYPDCNGNSQSPIDIDDVTPVRNMRAPIFINPKKRRFDDFTLSNEIHTVKITPPADTFYILPPGTRIRYNVRQYHLHFGKPGETTGSEHTVEGQPFRAEGHMVTSRTLKSGETKYAVFATLFEVYDSHYTNELFEMITSYFEKVSKINTKTEIEGFNFRDLLPQNLYSYYRYSGSFTTPPCTEGVNWFVFKETVKLTTEQFKRFGVLLSSGDGEKMAGNFRPTQPINDRIIISVK